MILMFGPAGSGKSLQGQILAARYNWDWISVGRLLRQISDTSIEKTLEHGDLLPAEVTDAVVAERLDRESDLSRVILDGFPRSIEQAQSLIEYFKRRFGDGVIPIETVVVLDIGKDEILKRLAERGRSDDNEEAIGRRLDIFYESGQTILDYFRDNGVRIDHIAANRSVGQIHDDIDRLLTSIPGLRV